MLSMTGDLGSSYNMHQLDPSLGPSSSSSSQMRTMPFLVPANRSGESSGQPSVSGGTSLFTFLPGESFLNSPSLEPSKHEICQGTTTSDVKRQGLDVSDASMDDEDEWGGDEEEPLTEQSMGQQHSQSKLLDGTTGVHSSRVDRTVLENSEPVTALLQESRTSTQDSKALHKFNQSSEHPESSSESARAYLRIAANQSGNPSEIFPVYGTSLMGSDSYNFPTGVELLAMHPTQNSVGDTSRGSAENLNGVHEGGSAFVGSLYPEQNIVDREYNPDPPLKLNWNMMPEPQYNSNNSLLDNNVHSNLRGMSPLVETHSLLSQSLQDNPYAHGPPQNRDGSVRSYFSSPQTQTEAMQLCLNPGNYSPERSTQAASGNLVHMPAVVAPLLNNIHNSQSQQRFLNIHLPPPELTQNALAHMNLNLANQAMSSAPLPVYNNWRNGGNELLFLPGSEPTIHTQPFSNQLSSQIQQQNEIAQYGSRRTSTQGQQGQTVHHGNSSFHNGDPGQSSGGIGNCQGLSLSLSSQQPSSLQLLSNLGRPESDIDAFATMSQASLDPKGKRPAECTDGSRYNNNGISLSRFRPQREDGFNMTGHQGLQNSYHQTVHPEADTSKQQQQQHLFFNSISNDHFMPVQSLTFYSNKMLRCCQILLNEICNIKKTEKRTIVQIDQTKSINWSTDQTTIGVSNNFSSFHTGREVMGADNPTRKENYASNMMAPIPATNPLESGRGREGPVQYEMRPENRVELENRKLKLTSYIEELDGRYSTFSVRMTELMTKFNTLAGEGCGTAYTAVAMQTISQSFRSLKDLLNRLLRDVKTALGENQASPGYNGRGEMSRQFQFLDQQVRQQQALQQLGVLQQHAWRPQRGLPERAVSVLRAWLFEHFLHPYPKDLDKVYLSNQTGLTRSQVSNWFINARVRLWKPMVEEMYNEEFNCNNNNNDDDEGGPSAGRNPSTRERRRTETNNEAMVSNDASTVTLTSEQAERDAAVERQRITIASIGEGLFARSNFVGSSCAHGMTNQNSENQLDFDATDRGGGISKKSRLNGMNHQIDSQNILSSGSLVHMEMDSGSHFQSDHLRSSNYGSSSEQSNYSQHQDILTTSNGGKFGAYGSGGGGSLNQGYHPGSSFLYNRNTAPTSGGVSFLTLGLSDGLGEAPGAQSNQGQQSSGRPGTNHHIDNHGIDDTANCQRGSDFFAQNSNSGQDLLKLRSRIPGHLLHEFVPQG